MTPLAAYLLAAMTYWVGLPDAADGDACLRWERDHFERADAARERLAEVAGQLDVEGDQIGPRRALHVAAIAFAETQLARYVDDGTCNLTGQLRTLHAAELAHGTCDEGGSFTMWQFNRGALPTIARLLGYPVTGDDLLADRRLAIHVAALLVERYPRAWTQWRHARGLADSWWRAHPFGT